MTEASSLEVRARGGYVLAMNGSQPAIAEVAALVGNPARANILIALMDGRALTASELAYVAGVSPQTASEHLARLTAAKLLSLAKQGRHCYFRLGSPKIARMIESIMVVAADGPQRYQPRWSGDEELRTARTCYDHIAGRLGVALTDALTRDGHVVLGEDGGMVTPAGEKLLSGFGVLVEEIRQGRRTFCRPCLDWSERRPHLAGALGAALADRCFQLGWIARVADSRTLAISAKGARGFAEVFGVVLPEPNGRHPPLDAKLAARDWSESSRLARASR
jgi:DNA-binding transcriptional ArsR family regulator